MKKIFAFISTLVLGSFALTSCTPPSGEQPTPENLDTSNQNNENAQTKAGMKRKASTTNQSSLKTNTNSRAS